MEISGAIQFIASLVEVAVAFIALLIAIRRKKTFGFFIAIAFGLLVVFNIARIFALEVPAVWDSMVFLIAGVSMLCAIWLVGKEP